MNFYVKKLLDSERGRGKHCIPPFYMEYQKNNSNFSFGFGTMKTAGTGNLSGARKIRTKKARLSKAKTAAKAGFLAAVFLIKHNQKKKNK